MLLFALDADANRHLSRQFAGHQLQKTYLALVAGSPPPQFTVRDHLRSGVRGRTVRVNSGGQPAETIRHRSRLSANAYWGLTAERTKYQAEFLAAMDKVRVEEVVAVESYNFV